MDNYSIKKLPNGMEIILIPNQSVQSFSLCISIRVGSNDETPEVNGVSHLLEHMLYKTNHLFKSKYDLYKALDAIGANYNAYTDRNITTFFVKSDAIHQEQIIRIFSNLICRPSINKKDLENEKKVVIEEIRNTQHEPIEIILNRSFLLHFPEDPISQTISGSTENIEEIRKKEVERHLATFYTANNMVVSICGKIAVNIDDILAKSFFNVAKQDHNQLPPKPILAPIKRCLINMVQLEVPQLHIGISFPTEGMYSADKYALNVIDLILNGSMSSRLFVRLREKEGLVYSINSGISNYQEAGLFYIYTTCDIDKYAQTIGCILDEIKQIQQHTVQKNELDRWKNYIRSTLVMSNENSMEVADYYAREMLFSRQHITVISEKIDRLMAISSKQIKETARSGLDWKKMKIVMVGNIGNKKSQIIENINSCIKETFC
jgi:predicted Zn-dependent peptidase